MAGGKQSEPCPARLHHEKAIERVMRGELRKVWRSQPMYGLRTCMVYTLDNHCVAGAV
jgi:hypothetical protein